MPVDRTTLDRSIEVDAGFVDPSQFVIDFAGGVGEFGLQNRRGLSQGFERILVSAHLGQGRDIRHVCSSAIVSAQIRPRVRSGDLREGLDGRLIGPRAKFRDGFVQRLRSTGGWTERGERDQEKPAFHSFPPVRASISLLVRASSTSNSSSSLSYRSWSI